MVKKILHISPGPFCDGWTYQDNVLTKYHVKLGYKVTMLTSNWVFNSKGGYSSVEPCEYINNDGVKVIRLAIKNGKHQNYHFKKFVGFSKAIESEKPDLIFLHNLNYLDIKKVYLYCKNHKSVILLADNHCDESNSGRNFISKYFFHKMLWKKNAKLIDKYCKHFFGVLPARVDFLTNYYKISPNKTSLLIMGADDEMVEKYKNNYSNRSQYFSGEIGFDTTLIVSGGKIDRFKLQTLSLMKYVLESPNNICLIVFGSVDSEIKQDFFKYVDNKKVRYIGWLNSEQTYEYISLSDICVFPGRHSVIWEQAVAQQKPLIVKRWDGTNHVNFNGNVRFIDDDNYCSLKAVLDDSLEKNRLNELKVRSKGEGYRKFLYSNIAKESLWGED